MIILSDGTPSFSITPTEISVSLGTNPRLYDRCVFRPGNDDHGSKSLLIQFGGPEWSGVDIAIEQEDDIGWLKLVIDDQIIGNTGQDLGAERKGQDDQQQENRPCGENVPQGMFFTRRTCFPVLRQDFHFTIQIHPNTVSGMKNNNTASVPAKAPCPSRSSISRMDG